MHKQTGIVHHAQQQNRPHGYTSRVAQTEKNRGRVADGFRQRTGRNNLNRHGSQDKPGCTCRFCACHPNIVPQQCHITQWVTVVGANMTVVGCSSQQLCSPFGSVGISVPHEDHVHCRKNVSHAHQPISVRASQKLTFHLVLSEH